MIDSVWESVSGWLQPVVEARWWLVAAVAAAGAGFGAWVWWWRRRARIALSARHSVQLLPAQTFEPTRTQVLGTAPRLHRLPQLAGLLPRRAGAVRIQLSMVEGEMVYLLHAPIATRNVLDLPLHDGVEIHPADRPEQQVPRIRFANTKPATEKAP
ncbi:hypothetical protein [Streptomyces xiamenensis]|uniref:hypothetical protein n=1 Tax=Streptomyces xiamenensis TaxID=408015 RepID=UPI0035D5A433